MTAPGTGLGMSIVKQIVDLSGGIIDIRSELNKGTEVKLSLPLENCLSEPADSQANPETGRSDTDLIDAVRRRTKGRSVSVQGFDDVSGKSDLQLRALAALKASVEKYVTEWFKLTLISTDQVADITVSDESAYRNTSVSNNRFKILLILCSNAARRDIYPDKLEPGQMVEFVSKPCGPHRLAKALLNCLDSEAGSPMGTPTDRVSLERPHSGAVSQEAATMTAGTNSSRLIGNLQSYIGFSPTSINQMRVPGLQAASEPTDGLRWQSPTDKAASIKPMPQPSGSRRASDDNSETSSYGNTPTSSTSHLEAGGSGKGSSTDEPASSPRRPKMLLVEVRHRFAR